MRLKTKEQCKQDLCWVVRYLINFQRYFEQENILLIFLKKSYSRDFVNSVFSLSIIIVAVNIVSLNVEEEVWKVKGLRKMQQEDLSPSQKRF